MLLSMQICVYAVAGIPAAASFLIFAGIPAITGVRAAAGVPAIASTHALLAPMWIASWVFFCWASTPYPAGTYIAKSQEKEEQGQT